MATGNSTHAHITAALIRRLKPDPKRDTFIRDIEVTGFGVRVKRTGHTSTFAQSKVIGTGQQRYKTIAPIQRESAKEQDVKAARSAAMKVLADWRGGTDTVAVERARGELPTLQEVLDSYIPRRGVKPRTAAEYQSLLDTHLAPFANRSVDTIRPGEVKDLHERVSVDSPSRADAACRVLRALWTYAAADNLDEHGNSRLIGRNPCEVLKGLGAWNGNTPKSSHITQQQFPAWYRGVLALEGERSTSRADVVRDFFLFCVFTGVRRDEALNLDSKDVDLDAATFTLRDTKNGTDFVLPASKPVLAILKRRVGKGAVFPIDRNSIPAYRAMVTEASGVRFSTHDLRRTFATTARVIGISKQLIGELLNHKTGRDVTAGYIAQSPEPYRKPLEQIARHFMGLAR